MHYSLLLAELPERQSMMTDPAEAERIASAARQAAREFREGMGR
jgi:hypothetical protein